MSSRWTFTSESVTEGHPDKMADQISDAVLDAILTEDPTGRVACETLLTTGLAVVAGEISTTAYVDIPKIARETICGIGYDRESFGFDGNTCGVVTAIDEQSPDILTSLAAVKRPGQTVVGFAAETKGLHANATEKLVSKSLDLVVANDVSAEGVGFQHDTNAVQLLSADGTRQDVALTDKRMVARAVLDAVLDLRSQYS